MSRIVLRSASFGAVLMALVACQSLATVMDSKSKGGGTTVEYPVTPEQAYEISMTIFRWEGSDAIEEHKLQGYVLTSWTRTVAGAFIEAIDPGHAKVTVVTQRRSPTALMTDLTESTFHDLFAQSVDLLKAGKPLPLTSPGRQASSPGPRK